MSTAPAEFAALEGFPLCYELWLELWVAIKKINLQELRRKQLTFHEIMIMKRHRSPSVVNYLDSYLLSEEELWLVMEYMDGGALSEVISKTSLSEDDMAAISRECLQGLDFLHSNHVIYRDVKSSNILLRTDGCVKLGQYILGQVQHSRDVGLRGCFEWLPAPQKWCRWQFRGTRYELMTRL
ncbi:serine/threonine-protein kinase PAK 3-like [Pyrgilauda ruficollis]|uniref:serine/threonine-protein kinase PAK 3-like n=1 Tax=Pyrgilauda ruficollis TaxID=221976 RepID=UPI001B877693|nr:serine/threonine-protein kinase PAK 3-like [Pyrgilauda ruficollis]